MSVGPLANLASSVAAIPLAQAKGSEVERMHQDATAQQRQFSSELKAERAAGIGETDGQEHQAAERDADGRRLWEEQAGSKSSAPTEPPPQERERLSKDITGQSGANLDLCG